MLSNPQVVVSFIFLNFDFRGLLFDLNENQAKDSVMRNCLGVLKHSGENFFKKKLRKENAGVEIITPVIDNPCASQIFELKYFM